MGYGKKWKVSTSILQQLIANADSSGDCFIEVWNSAVKTIEDPGTELWLDLATGWSDTLPEDPPTINPTL